MSHIRSLYFGPLKQESRAVEVSGVWTREVRDQEIEPREKRSEVEDRRQADMDRFFRPRKVRK